MKKKKRRTGEEIKEQKKKAKQDKVSSINSASVTSSCVQFDPSKQTTAADLVNRAGPSSQPLPPPSPALPTPVRPLPATASISDLRARLHSKIEGFRKDRGVDDSDPQSRSALEAETRRRRGEMRDRRRRERKEERRKAREKEAVTGKSAKVSPDDRLVFELIECSLNLLSRLSLEKMIPSHTPLSSSRPPLHTRTTSSPSPTLLTPLHIWRNIDVNSKG